MNNAFFPHFNWEFSKRLTTDNTGAVYGVHGALPFGDDFVNVTGHRAGTFDDFGGMWDGVSSMHAQFRDYNPSQGRWHSPDPYDGSYDFSNPQSLSRYSYVLNNPLAFTDPSGQDACAAAVGEAAFGGPIGGTIGGLSCVAELLGIGKFLEALFGFGGPSFHGSLKPRPEGTGNPDWANADGSFGETLGLPSDVNWSKINPGIAGALGLPDAGCEFGACGDDFTGRGSSPNRRYHCNLFGNCYLQASSLLNLFHLGPFRINGSQLTYGDWCGPGGSGPNIWSMDGACHVHDTCLDNLHLTWGDETKKLPGDLGSKLQSCNQTLYNSAAKVGGVGGWTIDTFFHHYGNYTCH